ncbi:Cu-binding protein [Puttea exsequens]|nr:Cu-binding protein [Puttea exsequens]
MSHICPRTLAPFRAPSKSFHTALSSSKIITRTLHRPSSLHPLSCPQTRALTTSSRRPALKATTVQQAEHRKRSGPFSAAAAFIFIAAGLGLAFYFRYEKERMERKRIRDASKGVGRPKVGGKFELVDQEGRAFSEGDLKGGFSLALTLVSTQTTHAISRLAFTNPNPTPPQKSPLLPVFITCDPARDTPAVLKRYLAEFHPGIVGLTGSWQQVKDVCKAYRVYFSTPEGVKPGMDYLVDHSIYFYLMDPDGDFVEAIGRQHSAEAAARIIVDHINDWKGEKMW